ncbi:ATP-binding protein, partial [Rhizobium hidalgonense]
KCTADMVSRYRGRLSGPLMDRIDLHIEVPALPTTDLQSKTSGEASVDIRKRVIAARERQLTRQGMTNAALNPQLLDQFASLGEPEQRIISMAQQRLNLSARAYHRVLRVARTIADLNHDDHITTSHLTEALSYRGA